MMGPNDFFFLNIRVKMAADSAQHSRQMGTLDHDKRPSWCFVIWKALYKLEWR